MGNTCVALATAHPSGARRSGLVLVPVEDGQSPREAPAVEIGGLLVAVSPIVIQGRIAAHLGSPILKLQKSGDSQTSPLQHDCKGRLWVRETVLHT